MANPNDRLGHDMKCRADLDRTGRSSSGAELVVDSIHHRLTTGLLPLIDSEDGNADFGEDVRTWLGEATTVERLIVRATTLGSVLERDERIATADVTVANLVTSAAGLVSFALDIIATLATGEQISARVGVTVDGVTVELLSQGR